MPAHPDRPSHHTGNTPSREVLAPLIDLGGKHTRVVAKLFVKADDPVRLLDEYTLALEAIDIHRGTHRRLARKFGRLCCRISRLPASLTLPVELVRREDGYIAPPVSEGFSCVWKGRHNGRVVALKQFLLYINDEDSFAQAKKDLWKDVALWKKLSHENVIPFYGVDACHLRVALVYPWAENQDIQQYLKANPGASRPNLLFQVTKGLQYLHSVDIVHGTLKSANVLINNSGGVWLADYGLHPFLQIHNHLDLISNFDAPEVMPTGVILKPGDIFAFAMLVVEVFTGQKPFGCSRYDVDTWMQMVEGKRPEKPMNVLGLGFSDGIWDLVQRCWAQDYDERPIIDDVVWMWEKLMNDSRGVQGHTEVTLKVLTGEDGLEGPSLQ